MKTVELNDSNGEVIITMEALQRFVGDLKQHVKQAKSLMKADPCGTAYLERTVERFEGDIKSAQSVLNKLNN